MFSYLIDAFSGAGMAFMWAITAIFAFGLAVFIERTWFLLIRWRVDTTELARLLAHGEPDQVLALTSHAPLGAVLQAGLESPDPDAAWDAMGAAAAEAEHRIRMRIPYLATIGNVATMLGLLGTVYGLILAFSSLGDTSAGERAVLLSQGISTAMATTAYGLMVGIPALLAHSWLDGQARALLAGLESAAGRLSARLRR